VITSGEGAAIEDIRSVLARRYPLADVVLCPVPVQGIDAPAALTNAINAFSGLGADHPQRPDVLIIGRGGGSAEDLWAFNEEPVARALAACTVPTISAVGHETDTSITDFVADRTAATPSMAAEIAVPDQQALRTQVRALHEQMHGPLARRIRRYRQTVERLQNTRALHSPRYQVEQHRQHLDHVVERLSRTMRARVDRLRTRVQTAQQRLHSADPQRPMQHGFALVTQRGEPVTRAADLDPNVPVALRFRDGTRQATVHAPSDASADSE
jgi:exodeoxyribonuclease VII large subunit